MTDAQRDETVPRAVAVSVLVCSSLSCDLRRSYSTDTRACAGSAHQQAVDQVLVGYEQALLPHELAMTSDGEVTGTVTTRSISTDLLDLTIIIDTSLSDLSGVSGQL